MSKHPSDPVKARLVWVHGFSDHCNNYEEFFTALAEHGIAVFAFDQRGWGRSVTCPSEKGKTGPTETVLSDITDFITSLPESSTVLFLGGHSMGGAEVLLWASRGPPEVRRRVRGYILEAPFLRLHPSGAPSSFTLLAARWASKLFPGMQLYQKQRLEWICRDERVREETVRDPLIHDTGTLEGLVAMLRRAEELDRGMHDLKDTTDEPKNVWIGHGDQDHLVSIEASKAFFVRMNVKDKLFETYHGFYHILHKEPGLDKVKFMNDVIAWISNRTSQYP